ncbi:MAG: YkgJ family cysteine cluster protein [Bacteroidetes bacterium]|nr:YkgJ family cysteine cluster protein [Bacteroidota bacterium]
MQELTNVSVEFMVFDQKFKVDIPVKTEPIHKIEFLTVLHPLTDLFVDFAVEKSIKEGKTISCKKGCGACCRQLVPITESEVYLLYEALMIMPKKNRNKIQQQFEKAINKLDKAELLELLEDINELTSEELRELGEKYFALGIACPFLENESCSIHHNRPMACREYLVTSPAINCSNPQKGMIDVMPLPNSISVAAAQLDEPLHSNYVRQVPLIFSLWLAEEFPDDSPQIDSVDMLRKLFSRMAKKQIKDEPNKEQ